MSFEEWYNTFVICFVYEILFGLCCSSHYRGFKKKLPPAKLPFSPTVSKSLLEETNWSGRNKDTEEKQVSSKETRHNIYTYSILRMFKSVSSEAFFQTIYTYLVAILKEAARIP